MTILPLDQIGFGPRSHVSALWWLGMLYRRPRRLRDQWDLMSLWAAVRSGVALCVHALPWMFVVCILFRFLLFGLMGLQATTEITEPRELSRWHLAQIVKGIGFGFALGIAGGIALEIVGRKAFTRKAIGIEYGITFGIALGLSGGITFGIGVIIDGAITSGIAVGIAFGISIGIVDRISVGVGIALVITFGIAFGIAYGIVYGIAFGIAATRGYYQLIAWPLSWPWPMGRWYRLHPVAWDNQCGVPFPGFTRLLLAYEQENSAAARMEIDRLISDYPSQRPAALRALTTLIARDAAMLTDLALLLNTLRALPEGDRGYLRQTPRIRALAADISHAQQRLNEITRPLFREREAQNLRTEILNFRNNVAGMREPLATEFPEAADRWLEVADRQLAELTALVGREPTPAVFRAGEPVDSEHEAFIARVNIAAELERLASQPAGARCVLLYGRRRMGKSVVLRNLRVILPETISVATISMEAAQAFASLEDLLEVLSQMITDSVGRAILPVPTDDGQDCPCYIAPRTLVEFEQLLGDTNRRLANEGRKLIVAIDEYEYLDTKLGERVLPVELLATLRNSIQTHPQLLWMFAGSHDITELSRTEWTSYLISAHTIDVPPFTPGETRLLLTDPLKHSTLWRSQPDQRPRFDPAFWGPAGIERIHEETVGWPNFVQLVAQVLVDRANDEGLESLEAEHLEWAFNKAIGTAHSTLARIVKDECRLPGEWEYLIGFRRADHQPLPIDEEVLRSLKRRLMVVEEGDRCRMFSPLMHRWLRERG